MNFKTKLLIFMAAACLLFACMQVYSMKVLGQHPLYALFLFAGGVGPAVAIILRLRSERKQESAARQSVARPIRFHNVEGELRIRGPLAFKLDLLEVERQLGHWVVIPGRGPIIDV